MYIERTPGLHLLQHWRVLHTHNCCPFEQSLSESIVKHLFINGEPAPLFYTPETILQRLCYPPGRARLYCTRGIMFLYYIPVIPEVSWSYMTYGNSIAVLLMGGRVRTQGLRVSTDCHHTPSPDYHGAGAHAILTFGPKPYLMAPCVTPSVSLSHRAYNALEPFWVKSQFPSKTTWETMRTPDLFHMSLKQNR